MGKSLARLPQPKLLFWSLSWAFSEGTDQLWSQRTRQKEFRMPQETPPDPHPASQGRGNTFLNPSHPWRLQSPETEQQKIYLQGTKQRVGVSPPPGPVRVSVCPSHVWEQQVSPLWQLWQQELLSQLSPGQAEPYLLLVLDAVRGLLELADLPDNVWDLSKEHTGVSASTQSKIPAPNYSLQLERRGGKGRDCLPTAPQDFTSPNQTFIPQPAPSEFIPCSLPRVTAEECSPKMGIRLRLEEKFPCLPRRSCYRAALHGSGRGINFEVLFRQTRAHSERSIVIAASWWITAFL